MHETLRLLKEHDFDGFIRYLADNPLVAKSGNIPGTNDALLTMLVHFLDNNNSTKAIQYMQEMSHLGCQFSLNTDWLRYLRLFMSLKCDEIVHAYLLASGLYKNEIACACVLQGICTTGSRKTFDWFVDKFECHQTSFRLEAMLENFKNDQDMGRFYYRIINERIFEKK
jgi:hypothetical protein